MTKSTYPLLIVLMVFLSHTSYASQEAPQEESRETVGGQVASECFHLLCPMTRATYSLCCEESDPCLCSDVLGCLTCMGCWADFCITPLALACISLGILGACGEKTAVNGYKLVKRAIAKIDNQLEPNSTRCRIASCCHRSRRTENQALVLSPAEQQKVAMLESFRSRLELIKIIAQEHRSWRLTVKDLRFLGLAQILFDSKNIAGTNLMAGDGVIRTRADIEGLGDEDALIVFDKLRALSQEDCVKQMGEDKNQFVTELFSRMQHRQRRDASSEAPPAYADEVIEGLLDLDQSVAGLQAATERLVLKATSVSTQPTA